VVVDSILNIGLHKIILIDCTEEFVCILNESNELLVYHNNEMSSIEGGTFPDRIVSIHIVQ